MGNRELKDNVLHCAGFLFSCFVLLAAWVVYLQVFDADALLQNPLNSRRTFDNIRRGAILDAQGQELAYGVEDARRYPFGEAMAPVTGYLGKSIGSAGMESQADRVLQGVPVELRRIGPAAQLLLPERGNDVKLTVDARIQQAAYDALGDRRGAVVVLDAKTGAVLAMASRPSFDPERVEEAWDSLRESEDSPLLNRALQGLYPPGSAIKPLIADAALESGVTDTAEIFDCTGTLDVGDGQTIGESHGARHGRVDLAQALSVSCNVVFGTLAMRLGGEKLSSAFRRFGFGKEMPEGLGGASPRLPDFSVLSHGELAQIGIGQGELLVTPLSMALLSAAFANHGVAMKPYMIDEIISPEGRTVEKIQPEEWFAATSPERADLIDGFMENAVENGTGTAAEVHGIRVAGKTGTAENPRGEEHAWFIGSAELPRRKIAFAIIVENGGSGGADAAPVAREIVLRCLDDESE